MEITQQSIPVLQQADPNRQLSELVHYVVDVNCHLPG